ncbi:winged helix-turn-helix transcriptional regulator [bacterium]|nr:winged helix-turn-helix transcriptional regulator [bacterium]
MSQLLLFPDQIHAKMLKFIERFLLKQGLNYQVVKNADDILERSISKIKPLRIKGYSLYPEIQSLVYKKNKIFFRKKEFELLHFMLLNHGVVIDRNTILERVWGVRSNPFTNTVDVHMSYLRKKLAEKSIIIIKTIHGVGYKLEI